jgi:hypothetical protein
MTQLRWNAAVASLASLAALAGCSSSSSGSTTDGGGGGGSPTITISSPASGAMITVTPPNDTLPLTFATTNFTLAAAGTCPPAMKSTDNCGHIHILVDGSACTPEGGPYNNEAHAPGTANAILSSCPMANGAHTVMLELHHDDHSPVKDASGNTIAASVMVTVTGG